ncbi:MAG: phosphoribosylanthranilate isomerase [Nitritalea sp.]
MALKTFVKINQVTNLSDARYCSGMYVDLLGFCMEEGQEGYVLPETFQEIAGWVSGVGFVAEFSVSHPDSILAKVQSLPQVTHIQVREAHHLPLLAGSSYSLIFAQKVESAAEIASLATKAQGFEALDILLLLESDTLTVATAEVREAIQSLAAKVPVLLAFDLEAQTLENTLSVLQVKGIALSGGQEIAPGLKDFDELATILEALEQED